jgi:hypothetical protein
MVGSYFVVPPFDYAFPYFRIMVVYPVYVMFAVLYSLQAVRYFIIKQFYIYVPPLYKRRKNENQDVVRKIRIFEWITSRLTFSIISLMVFVISALVSIALLLFGIFAQNLREADKASEYISNAFNVVVGLVTLSVFIIDLIFHIRHHRRKDTSTVFTAFQHLKNYFQDDPLMFRWEMMIVFTIVIFGVVALILAQFISSSAEIALRMVQQVFNDCVIIGIITISGGLVTVTAIVNFAKQKLIKLEPGYSFVVQKFTFRRRFW